LRAIIEQIRKSVVFLGKRTDKEDPQPYATGFLLDIHNVFHLATAKHVVVDPRTGEFIDSEMQVVFNLKDGKIGLRSVDEIKSRFGVNWLFHESEEVDIAIIPFGLDPQEDDVKTIPDYLFCGTDRLFELYDVFFLSYQPGIQPQKRICPIIRKGTISLINEDKTFYIDAFAFPGNSGSPVFLKPSPIGFDEGVISVGGDKLGSKFIGIIGEYVPYEEVAISTQTGRARVLFQENTGLSKVWSVAFINDIVESEACKQQLGKLRVYRQKLGKLRVYRRGKDGDTWHFCKNCSTWPTSNYVEQVSKQPPGELCNTCRAKEKAGNCQ